MKLIIEIRPGEGGDDAKLLVKEHAAIYINFANKRKLSVEVISESSSEIG